MKEFNRYFHHASKSMTGVIAQSLVLMRRFPVPQETLTQ